RREFIAVLGGLAVSPLAWKCSARAQQTRFVGFIHSGSANSLSYLVDALRQGLKDGGYIDGEKIVLQQRWAEGQTDRIAGFAAELAKRHVDVVIAGGGPSVALAAKSAASTTPIVFVTTADPVRFGLVANNARPGGNVTGINYFVQDVNAKAL